MEVTRKTPQADRADLTPGSAVTIMGLGLFGGGVAAARYFATRGHRVTVTDLKAAEALEPSLRQLDGLPITYRLGRHDPADFTGADLVVVNPAVPRSSPWLALAEQSGARLTSEMNLFFERCGARIVGVTGTSGKSTTTALVGEMLGRCMPTRVGGNIGKSLLEEAEGIGPGETVVLELSSFQLFDLGRIEKSPHTALVTCISENHLDWHGSMDAYVDAKKNVCRFQGAADLAILNADDPEVRTWKDAAGGRVLFYSAAGSPEADARADGTCLVLRAALAAAGRGERDSPLFPNDRKKGTVPGPRPADGEERLDLAGRLALRGRHNLANVLAAATAARALGAPLEAIADAIAAFRPLPHRLQALGRLRGVLFVDDSKATTPESARVAIEAFAEPVVLIAGGYDKKTDPAPMVEAARQAARAVILMGATAPALAEALAGGGPARPGRGPVVEQVEGIEEAVRRAAQLARPGDVVLLAPGHASWDMFDNYEQRGEAFRRAAEALGMQPLEANE